MGFFDFLYTPVKPTAAGGGGLLAKLKGLFSHTPTLSGKLLEEIEELLISADIDVETSEEIIKALAKVGAEAPDLAHTVAAMKAHIKSLLLPVPATPITSTPLVLLIVGVNGAGKTTSVAKLAARFTQEHKKVVIAAADTFRAAALEQLQVWGTQLQVPVIRHQISTDPSAAAYEGLRYAIAHQADVLLLDTAGRLHNKIPLMEELAKVKRVLHKQLPEAPHEIWLVVDGSTGQNALQQARLFDQTLGLTGIIVTKLDSLAKGGMIVSIAHHLHLPIRYLGVGEQAEALVPFDAEAFVNRLFQ